MADNVTVINYSPAPLKLSRGAVDKVEPVSVALELIRAATVGCGGHSLSNAMEQLPKIVEAIETAVGKDPNP
ncbi:MAG: hypothetical protein O7C01_00025 [Actinobacteria bacterium]|nr:hypothetical protein [Actinomycetota bacterium]